MEVVYTRATWIISKDNDSEDKAARELAKSLEYMGRDIVVLPDDFESAKQHSWLCRWITRRDRPKTIDTDHTGLLAEVNKESIPKFISAMSYYEQINLHIALLMVDNPKLSTNDAYVFAATHFDNDDHTGLRYYLDKAMHMTTYK